MCSSRSQPEVMLPPRNGSFEMAVATVFQKASEQVYIGCLKSSTVESLKADDPFMYYSIQSLKNHAMLNENVSSCRVDSSNSSEYSTIEMEYIDSGNMDDNSCIVTRLSRLSVECHADLIYAQLMGDTDDTDSDHDSDMEDDYFLSAVVGIQDKNPMPVALCS